MTLVPESSCNSEAVAAVGNYFLTFFGPLSPFSASKWEVRFFFPSSRISFQFPVRLQVPSFSFKPFPINFCPVGGAERLNASH